MNESSINLTGREKDVLKLMIAGYSNPQISEKLFNITLYCESARKCNYRQIRRNKQN